MVDEYFPTKINSSFSLFPVSGLCYSFLQENHTLRETVWVVPHVIRHLEGTQIITWRCNWGNACESKCIYAMARKKNQQKSILFSDEGGNKGDPDIITQPKLSGEIFLKQ